MKKRGLGHSGLDISPIALAGDVFGWTVDKPTSIKKLDMFIAALPW